MNIVIISGNIGRDAETRYTSNGMAITSFNLAGSSGWGKNKKTEWFRCVLFKERGEKLAQFLRKGSKVTVQGEVKLNEYESQGEKRANMEIVVNDIVLPSRSENGSTGNSPSRIENNSAGDFQQPTIDFNDDIPF